MSDRALRKRDQTEGAEMSNQDEVETQGVSNDMELDRIPSSTSVFRTPSSIVSLSENMESRGTESS